ncbi:uncharacterized protein BROUX77_002343 [Berkeleyomyces rouxiae]|uniref:uncharacterized protein n=1 Tax=Berkeleyomyces rouxiae TaxID=2035830 RepID=UPI003B7AACF6
MTAIPAQLGFLAIYNPSLGTNDETIDEQVVYYASQKLLSKRRRRNRRRGGLADVASTEERNERLRQIGLAQGMVEFSRSFAGNQAVDSVETERSRVIVHELESGWWILASIDLARLPLPPKLQTGKQAAPVEEKYEYSTRDLKPANLLLCDLVRAHSIFLLHHAPSLSLFLEHRGKSRFLAVLGRYWDLFLSTWDVMLHGNPIRSLVGGIALAASGELGVGVGEEDVGSGERDVLEGLPWRMEGLVDLVVSKFGTADDGADDNPPNAHASAISRPSWIGSGKEPSVDDGAVFLGVGALSRPSLRDLVHWTEDLYTWGENAYGVVNPSSTKPSRKSRRNTFSGAGASQARIFDRDQACHQRRGSTADDSTDGSSRRRLRAVPPVPIQEPAHDDKAPPTTSSLFSQSIPQSLLKLPRFAVFSYETSSTEATPETTSPQPEESLADTSNTSKTEQPKTTALETSAMGSSEVQQSPNTLPVPSPNPSDDAKSPQQIPVSESQLDGAIDKFKNYLKLGYGTYWSLGGQDISKPTERPRALSSSGVLPIINKQAPNDPANHFLIGLRREVDHLLSDEDENEASDATKSQPRSAKTLRRTVQVTLQTPNPGDKSTQKPSKLRIVVYVNRPFIFVLLFDPATAALSTEAFYHTLHTHLAPMRNALIASTARPIPRPFPGIFDIVYDPASLTLLCSVPNIPVPVSATPAPAGVIGGVQPRKDPWSRADAISTHLHLLNIFTAAASRPIDVERSVKTSRGWWVVWTRVFKDTDDSTPGAASASASDQAPARGLETISESPVTSPLKPSKPVPESAETPTDANADADTDADDNTDTDTEAAASDRTCSPSPARDPLALVRARARRPRAVSKQVFLVRHASDHAAWRSFGASLMESVEAGSAGAGAGGSGDEAAGGALSLGRAAGAGILAASEGGVAGGLARGIGVDTRRIC